MERRRLAVSLIGCLAAAGAAVAQDPEITMRLIAEGAADVRAILTEPIELPDAASEEGVRHSAEGLATANANRAEAAERRAEALAEAEKNRQGGLDTAAEARERGAAFGAETAEAARANREDHMRGNAGLERVPIELPDLPQLPPELPDSARERVDVSDLPGRPGGG